MRRVIAYHVILTAYGFWLPNDPRGSWSDFVRAWELVRFGRATKTQERRSLANEPHNVAHRLEAKKHLVRRAVRFTGAQAWAIARGFAKYHRSSGLIIYACSILPTHVHLVIARHTCSIEQVSRLLKGAATTELIEERLHPFAHQPYRDGTLPAPWTRHSWSVFLDCEQDVERAVRYVERNPRKEGKRDQRWNFLIPLVRECFA